MFCALHNLAKLEAQKKISASQITQQTIKLLADGADVHHLDENGETPFNIAAPASPIIGRLMTNHWLALALFGLGTKKLNDKSGSHNSTLAQYIAKWSNAAEIGKQLDTAIAKGMNIAVQNSSGWTPLHAACAMVERFHAVRAFFDRYDEKEKNFLTTELYETRYSQSPELIRYDENLKAIDIAKARLHYAKTLPQKYRAELQEYLNYMK